MLRSLLLSAVAVAALTATAHAQDETPDALTRDDVKNILIETLNQNPEILVDALRTINEQQIQAREEIQARENRMREVAANEIGAPVGGNPDGDVTIVMFTDYNCEHCRAAADVVDSVVEQDGNVRVVYRELPILGPDSIYAAKAALAADMQGKYEEFHANMMDLDVQANTNSVLKAALDAGVDLNKMMVDLDSEKVVKMIENSKAVASEFGIEGTPTYFIGTNVASGTPSAGALRDVISQARQ